METVIHFLFQEFLIHINFKRTAFILNRMINVFTVTFDEFGALSLSLNKSIDFFLKVF